jgi:hypothetical protein
VVRQRYHNDLVTITEHSTIQYLNVHGGTDTEVLTMWGRTFKNVRGLDPCYLEIPNRHMVLFVTGRTYNGGQAVVHLADTATRRIRDFPAHDSKIGYNIGPDKTNGVERVFSLDGDKLIIEARFLDERSKYFIDLSVPRFEREELDLVDPVSKQFKHYVLENGKWPKEW